MPDRRRHRGPHPQDAQLFGNGQLPRLRAAARELHWLLDRGYPPAPALRFCGDHHQLDRRQRMLLQRASCTTAQAHARRLRRLEPGRLRGRRVLIDGFNVLITVEAALAGGLLLRAADGCLRDLASVHGTWKHVEETEPAARLLGDCLAGHGVAAAHWLLDQPVGNSGRLAARLRALAESLGLPWTVELLPSPDAALRGALDPVASADSAILDAEVAWFDLASEVVAAAVPQAWIVAPFDEPCGPRHPT